MIPIKAQISKKANKEIRIYDKETGKTKVISLYSENTIDQLKGIIVIMLEDLLVK